MTRGVGEYIALGRHVVDIGMPTVMFVTPDVASDVTGAWGNEGHVRIVVLGHDEWPCLSTVSDEGDLGSLRWPDYSTDRPKDSWDYIRLQWSKPTLVRDALRLTGSRWAWWMDLGIAHASAVPPQMRQALAHVPQDDVLIVRDLRLQPAGSPWRAPDGRGLACGGFFGVSAEGASWLVEATSEQRQQGLARRDVLFDEQLLTSAALASPDRFGVLNGTHATVLASAWRTGEPAQPQGVEPVSAGSPFVHLAELPGARLVPLVPELALPDGWAWMNPSIAADPRGGFLCAVRAVNYRFEGWSYHMAEGDGVVRTRNAIVSLTADLRLRSSAWLDDSAARVRPPLFPVHGLEDLRLFRREGDWWVLGARREHASSGEVRQVLARLVLDPGPTLADAAVLPTPVDGPQVTYEKNWMPIPDSVPRPAFIWSIDPLLILEYDSLTGRVTSTGGIPLRSHAHQHRGSSPVIRTAHGPLAIAHEVSAPVGQTAGPSRRDLQRVVTFGKDVESAVVGPPWRLCGEGFEYVAGAAATDESLVVSFGRDDASAWLAVIPWTCMELVMPEVPEP